MDIRNRSLAAIILKAQNYREHDRLLFIASAEAGIERVIARGARKPTSSLCCGSQPFAAVQLLLSPAKNGLSFARECLLEHSYCPLATSSLSSFAYAAYIADLTLAAWPENKPWPEFFGLLKAALTLLQLDQHHQRTASFFELRLLHLQGWLGDISCCSSCQAPVIDRCFRLPPADGSLLCEACSTASHGPLLSAGAVRTMQALLTAPLSRITKLHLPLYLATEMERALEYYLAYHLEYSTKAKRILSQLLED